MTISKRIAFHKEVKCVFSVEGLWQPGALAENHSTFPKMQVSSGAF